MQAGSRRFCVNAASVRCAGWPPIWSPSMLGGGFARSRSAGPVRRSSRIARSHVDLAARCRCRTCAPIADDRRANSCGASSRLDRALGFFSCHRVTELSGCSVAARCLLRFRPSWLVPANVGWLPRFMGCGVGGRWGGRAPDHRFGRFTRSRARADGRTVVGRSAAISVRRGDRGLSFANSGSPGFAAGYGRRLIALDLVFNAPGRLRRRRGATRFRERDGLRGGGSVGRFVWDLSVPGRACRRNRAVEMAPAVCDSAGGTFGAGSICEGAREGWGRVLDVRFAENQYRDRP